MPERNILTLCLLLLICVPVVTAACLQTPRERRLITSQDQPFRLSTPGLAQACRACRALPPRHIMQSIAWRKVG